MTAAPTALDARSKLTLDIGELVDECQRTLEADRPALVCLPAEAGLAERVVEAAAQSGRETFFWSPRTDLSPQEHVVGVDSAKTISASGNRRFTRVRDVAEPALHGVQRLSLLGCEALAPRAYGGFSFQVNDATGALWSNFGDARFVLPRWTYEQRGRRARIGVALDARDIQDRVVLRRRLSEALELSDPEHLPQLRPSPAMWDPPDPTDARQHWQALVGGILRRIGEGSCTKIVAARRADLTLEQPASLGATLAHLAQSSVDCTRFAFKPEASGSMVGATPERLIRKHARHVWTEALAGTFRREDSAFAAELLRSPKEHAEHAPVLAAIVKALAPSCSTLKFPDTPEVRELRHMLHLRSPVTGELSRDQHVLELVQALHPTPAVGGVPTAAALKWICDHELHQRGWYAGPVGWFDANGDGEFVVGLRSGMMYENKASLFVGAGIVRGSEPDVEFLETELKLRALRSALMSNSLEDQAAREPG